MHPNDCRSLDDYLAEDLEGPACEKFEIHLAECVACRHEVNLQRTIDRQLASENNTIEPPARLLDRIVQRSNASAWRRRAWGLFAAAAVLLLVAGASILGLNRWWGEESEAPIMPDEIAQRPSSGKGTPIESETTNPERIVQVTFPADQEIIVAEHDTDDSTVTILMVYTDYRPPNGVD